MNSNQPNAAAQCDSAKISNASRSDSSERSRLVIPELLAPAGDWDCAKAAVENGADAIYFGLERFNARMRAHNFTEAGLPELMRFLHGRGVKGYVTFNTLVFANEMAEAEQHLKSIIASGVDAAIVQDIGICRLIRHLSPDFPIHASTQMTVTSAGGVEFAKELGCNLVVLARECSLTEIQKIVTAGQNPGIDLRSDTSTSQGAALPLEVFVHGALCVAYSGQCLTSESLGGRSANRGECAQACRMPYELISDGNLVPLADKRYLLSPQDLAGLEVLPELVQAGVTSLKIEGRLKSPEYVANITRVYRNALDHLAAISSSRDTANRSRSSESAATNEIERFSKESRYNLEMAFSRGLHTGWFRGINNQELVHARFGKKRGVYLGEVKKIRDGAIYVQLAAPLKPGDGVVFDAGRPDDAEEGGRVYQVERRGAESEIRFGRNDLDFNRIHVGDKLWKTSDPALDRELRQTFSGAQPRFQRAIDLEIFGRAGELMTVIARDDRGNVTQIESSVPLVTANKQPLDNDRLREQLGRLGGTSLKLAELTNRLEGSVLLPMSELNRMRRQFVQKLQELRDEPKRWTLDENTATFAQIAPAMQTDSDSGEKVAPELIVLVRTMPQLEAALETGVQTLYCEFEDPKRYRDAVALVRNHRVGLVSQGSIPKSAPTIWAVPPRIFKMGEEWILKQVRSCEADGYLVRNYDHLKFFSDCRRVGDFSLNVANRLAADYFIARFGLERVTASYDLNFVQMEALLQSAPPQWFEITIHQHMPMFHMEHCVFCAFLSSGTNYTNCGRPCDKHQVSLRDRVGAKHPLKADAGCRNTVFNALAQTGAEYVDRMMDLGARRFRIEFLDETPLQTTQTIAKYRQLLERDITGAQLWRELKLLNQLGVTRGQMAK
jgi:U32 family peptidase